MPPVMGWQVSKEEDEDEASADDSQQAQADGGFDSLRHFAFMHFPKGQTHGRSQQLQVLLRDARVLCRLKFEHPRAGPEHTVPGQCNKSP